MSRTTGLIVALLVGAAAVLPGTSTAVTAQTRRISINSNENEKTGPSYVWKRALSQDGRIIAFESAAQLVNADDDFNFDVYVRNIGTGRTEMVSIKSNGSPGHDDESQSPEISANGRLVVFQSAMDNLVPNDENTGSDVFLYNRKSNKVRRMSVSTNGEEAEGSSTEASISPNGRYIAFVSDADNLIGNDGNGAPDVFVKNRLSGVTRRASIRSNGNEGSAPSERPSVADDGSVAFSSDADDLVASDDNGSRDTFVHKFSNGNTRLVSVAPNGDEGDGGGWEASISRDGDSVTFLSQSSNLVAGAGDDHQDIFLHRLPTGKTRLVSKHSNGTFGNADSTVFQGALSYNGRYVTFSSASDNLVNGDTNGVIDMFWHDMKTGKTKLVSKTYNGTDLSSEADEGSVSGNGRFVAFDSPATNLVPNDGNNSRDVFRRGPLL
jgi:Tol biopolymer transport system component